MSQADQALDQLQVNLGVPLNGRSRIAIRGTFYRGRIFRENENWNREVRFRHRVQVGPWRSGQSVNAERDPESHAEKRNSMGESLRS